WCADEGGAEKPVPFNNSRGSSSSTSRLYMRLDPYLPPERGDGDRPVGRLDLKTTAPPGHRSECWLAPCLNPRRASNRRNRLPGLCLLYQAQRNSRSRPGAETQGSAVTSRDVLCAMR